ncbi:MAG TPA: class I SAM-dependent methyltransferase [Nocardioides sp.]|uniref:class I SAM-dependent methyltransferase n=1 Tax=Nocardioides sp. TaxID=35761 RepID=UPI002D7F0970|nr:class I SAM-dependent methyltransferase [Nocardioides sp.]HET6652178.1 class I SAM-dependent methyltransferase [Nocardioides sp.]
MSLAPAVWAPTVGHEPSRFDAWAATYELSDLQALVFDPVHVVVADLLRRHADGRRALLDLGCGTGRLLRRLRTEPGGIAEAVGVDPAPRMLAEARRRRTPARLVCASAERLPFPTGAFEVVTVSMSVRHWQDRDAGLAQVARVLAPGGVLVVGEPRPAGASAPRPRRRWGLSSAAAWPGLEVLGGHGLDVVDAKPAPVRGPVPPVDVVVARRR